MGLILVILIALIIGIVILYFVIRTAVRDGIWDAQHRADRHGHMGEKQWLAAGWAAERRGRGDV
jgi:hypothetical protein